MSLVAPVVVKPVNTTTNRSVDDLSVRNVCGGSRSTAVYGFQHCSYTAVKMALETHPQIQRVYDCSLGEDRALYQAYVPPEAQQRLDGARIQQVPSGAQEADDNPDFDTQAGNRLCKASITNLVLENFRRKKAGQELIPIIVCVNKEANNIPLTSENLLSKTKTVQVTPTHILEMNRIVTHSELRRMHKLCEDVSLDPELRAVAKESLKFVKVSEATTQVIDDTGPTTEKTVNITYSLEANEAPWEAVDFGTELAKRKLQSVPKQPKGHDWRVAVSKVVQVEKAKAAEIEKAKAAQIAKANAPSLLGRVVRGTAYLLLAAATVATTYVAAQKMGYIV